MYHKYVVISILVAAAFFSQGCPKKSPAANQRVDSITAATPRTRAAMTANASNYDDSPPMEYQIGEWMFPEEPSVAPQSRGSAPAMAAAAVTTPYIELYTDKKSYLPGETVNFCVSTTAATYSLQLYNDADWSRQKVMDIAKGLPGNYYPIPPVSQKPWQGANWPVTFSWKVPDSLENGSYLVIARTTSGDYTYQWHPFIVSPRIRGSFSRIAYLMNYRNRCSYNYWGGKSFYDALVPGDPTRAETVSMLRPFAYSYGRGHNYWGQWELASQLKADGYNPEFITEDEINSHPEVLLKYDVIVFSHHHEYLTRNIFDALEAHHKRGGHIAFFSANDLYWQTRYENDGHRQTSYKGRATAQDPMVGVDNSLVTCLFSDPPVNRPPEAFQGISYTPESYMYAEENYLVQNDQHFIFEGTGLKNGDALGTLLASGENDYIGPDSPAKLDIVLYARRTKVKPEYAGVITTQGADAAAIFYADTPEYGYPNGKGGRIFSSGTHAGWGNGIATWSLNYEQVRIVTRNILNHMLASPRPAPAIEDLAGFASRWLDKCNSPDWCDGNDLNMSGTVDLEDFALLATTW